MDWLKQIPIFADLDSGELEMLETLVHKRTFSQGDYIFREGDERKAVFFVRTGTIKVFKVDKEGREQIVSFLKVGDMFPHVGLFDDTPYPGTAQTLEESILAYISVQEFERLLLRQPKIAVKVTKVLGRKIIELQQKLHDVTLKTAGERIVHSLCRLSDQYGEEEIDGKLLSFRFTNQELANMVGTTRETANRVLSDLRKQGYIDLRTEGIWISNALKTNLETWDINGSPKCI